MDLKIHENLVVVFMVFLFFLIWWHFTLKKKVIYALMSPNSSDCVYSKLDVPSAPWPWEIQDLWLWKKKYIKLLFMHHRRGFLSIPLNYIKHQFCLCEFWSVTDGAHWTQFSDLRAWRSLIVCFLAPLDSPDCLNLHAHYVLKMMKLAIIWAVSLIIHFSLNCSCPRPTPFFF